MKKNKLFRLMALFLAGCLLAGCASAGGGVTTTAQNTTTVTTVAPTTTTTTVPTTATTTKAPTTTRKTTTANVTVATTAAPLLKSSVDLMKNVNAAAVQEKAADDAFYKAQWTFALKLANQANKQNNKNMLVSPLSAQLALAMLANGTAGTTKTQIEAVLGMKTEEYNRYAAAYVKTLTSGNRYTLAIANSLWVKRGMAVNKNFLQTNANYYNADVFQTDFDKQSVQDMNAWINEKTGGLIKEFDNEVDPAVLLSVFNTVAFDVQWLYQLDENKTASGVFTTTDGRKQSAEYLYSQSEKNYIKDDKAQGIIKEFSGPYSMAFVLPNEGITPEQYLSQLTADGVKSLLSYKSEDKLESWGWEVLLPKFDYDYKTDLKAALQQMGVSDLFTQGKADLSGISDGLFVRDADQKTTITMNECGVVASGVSRYQVLKAAAVNYLPFDRPFVYMIIDSNQLPIFVGTVTEMV